MIPDAVVVLMLHIFSITGYYVKGKDVLALAPQFVIKKWEVGEVTEGRFVILCLSLESANLCVHHATLHYISVAVFIYLYVHSGGRLVRTAWK